MIKTKQELLITLPVVVAVLAVHFRILVLIPLTGVLMFVLVAVLPFAHKHENLWLFLMCATSSIPINLFLLTECNEWKYYLCINADKKFLSFFVMVEGLLILTGVEEVVIGFIGRMIWRRQCRLNIPKLRDDD